jgi:predicted small lipoprotein YifL
MRTTGWALTGVCLTLLVLLAGCGQKGPLYLPDKNKSAVRPVTPLQNPSKPPEKSDPEQKDDSQQPPSPPAPQ